MRRSWMPVRCMIHSSVVSTNVARSALDNTAGGMHLPQPVMAAYVMKIPHANDVPRLAGGNAPRPGDRLPGF